MLQRCLFLILIFQVACFGLWADDDTNIDLIRDWLKGEWIVTTQGVILPNTFYEDFLPTIAKLHEGRALDFYFSFQTGNEAHYAFLENDLLQITSIKPDGTIIPPVSGFYEIVVDPRVDHHLVIKITLQNGRMKVFIVSLEQKNIFTAIVNNLNFSGDRQSTKSVYLVEFEKQHKNDD